MKKPWERGYIPMRAANNHAHENWQAPKAPDGWSLGVNTSDGWTYYRPKEFGGLQIRGAPSKKWQVCEGVRWARTPDAILAEFDSFEVAVTFAKVEQSNRPEKPWRRDSDHRLMAIVNPDFASEMLNEYRKAFASGGIRLAWFNEASSVTNTVDRDGSD